MAAPYADSNESSGVVPPEPPLGQQETLEMRAEDIKAKLRVAHRQIFFLNQQLYLMECLYKRAKSNHKHGFITSISTKIAIVSGIKCMYRHYVNAKLVELDNVFKQMQEEDRATTVDHSGGGRVQE